MYPRPNFDTYIYALFDPRTNEPRYVGKSDDPKRRLLGHVRRRKEHADHKHNWLCELRGVGLAPELAIIERCSSDSWEPRERHWIKTLRGKGYNLTNTSEGGTGVHNPPPEWREAVSKRMAGNKNGVGSKWGVEQRERFMAARKGCTFTAGHRASLSKAHGGLGPNEVEGVKEMLDAGASQRATASAFGVAQTTVGRIARCEDYYSLGVM